MITIYHNPRCSKSRQALALLEEKGLNVDIKLYLEKTMDKTVLVETLNTLGDSAIRKGEVDYKEFIKGKELTNSELADLMLSHPKTIERPLVINGNKMAIGRPIENIIEIL